jgi:pyruvate dehydrogenase E2 component (dihydrolipoamide acetyltransferase)
MEQGVIAKWLVKVGDKVQFGDMIADVETDKASNEMENYDEGTILYLLPADGNPVAVGQLIAVIGEPGEDPNEIINGGGAPAAPAVVVAAPVAPTPAPAAPAVVVATPAPAAPVVVVSAPVAPAPTAAATTDRLKASPLAKQIAKEKGIDITTLKGTGTDGRIIKNDIDNAPIPTATTNAPTTQVQHTGSTADYEDVPASQMRKIIARRLSESKFSAPHFYLTITVNMDNAMQTRTQINEIATTKVSFNDMVIKACAAALTQHPNINASWLTDTIRYNKVINIGVAMALPEGLVVPVVRNANQKGLSTIASEVKTYAAKAKDKKLQPTDWQDNTFTISNLGMMGIEEFTAIINPPDACILAVGAIVPQPIVTNGAITIGNIMKLTLSCDHRVVDGAMGAAFLQTLKKHLEEPVTMLV